MLTPSEKLKLCSMILEIGRHEKKIETVRQLLCEHSNFAPFTAFRSLDIRSSNRISAADIQHFLAIHCVNGIDASSSPTTPAAAPIVTLVSCELFIKLFDRNNDNHLSYDEFLSAILPQDNNLLRQTAISKDSMPAEKNQTRSTSAKNQSLHSNLESKEEIEYMLAKLIDWSIKGVTDLESEKYVFLGQQQRGSIALFLDECFNALDVDRRGSLTTTGVEAFFQANSQDVVVYTDEIRAFFRRASISSMHSVDTLSKNEFTAILDFAPYNQRKRPNNPPPCLLDNSYHNSFSSTPHATNPILFEDDHPNAAIVLRNTRSSINSIEQQPGSTKTATSFQYYSTAPMPLAASAPASNKSQKRKLSFHSSINERTEKESAQNTPILRNKNISSNNNNNNNKSNNNNIELDRSSLYNSVKSHESRARQPPHDHSIDSIGRQRIDEDNSRVGLIELLTHAKRRSAAAVSSGLSSHVSPSSRNGSIAGGAAAPSTKKSNSRKSSVSPFTFGIAGGNVLNASFQSSQTSRRSSIKQTLIDFKQEIRGELASSKARYESLSPMKSPTPQAKFNTSTKPLKQPNLRVQDTQQPNSTRSRGIVSKPSDASNTLQNSFNSTVKSQSNRRQSLSSNSGSIINESSNNPSMISNIQQSFTSSNNSKFVSFRENDHARKKSISHLSSGATKSSTGSAKKSKRNPTNSHNQPQQFVTRPAGITALQQSMATHVNNYIMCVLSNAKRSEVLKTQLSARHDFNMFQLFELLDRQSRGSISSYDILLFLESQSVSIPLTEIVILMKRLDRLQIGTVSFSSFSVAALTSAQHERIGANRSAMHMLPDAALSKDTIRVFTELLEELIAGENKLELLRQLVAKDKQWDCYYAFDLLDRQKTGGVTRESISLFLEAEEGFLVSKKDLDLIFDFFEVEYAESLRLDQFVAELQPRTPF